MRTYIAILLVHAGEREFDRIQGNAANIGFMSHMDTGIDGFASRFGVVSNLRSITDLLHRAGVIVTLRSAFVMRRWVRLCLVNGCLPYNEIVAQWVDPFYDAGADSHTSIMGNVGFGGVFYNGGTFPLGSGTDFSYEGQYALSFNRPPRRNCPVCLAEYFGNGKSNPRWVSISFCDDHPVLMMTHI